YGDFRWVRYYDDAVLVDLRSGEIVDIIYDVFF
ncbi:MAG: RcnB family protein, partial [Alphaproteobacteria bacterium]